MNLKEYAYTLVQEICQERISQHKSPVVAIFNEISRKVSNEVQIALEELTAEGRLVKTENVNRIPMFYPTPQKS